MPPAPGPAATPGGTLPLPDADAILWTLDRDPQLRSTIVAVALFDGEPAFERVLDKVRVLCRDHRRFRSIVVPATAPWSRPAWREVAGFDPDSNVTHVRAPRPGNERGVLDLAQSMGSRAFDTARPLWEIALVDGLEGGRSALVIKVHHSVIDGIGGLLVVAGILDVDRGGTDPVDGTTAAGAKVGAGSRRARPVAAIVHGAAAVPRHVLGPVRGTLADPAGSVRHCASTVVDALALVAPTPTPFSPLMGARGLDRHFGTVRLPPDLDLRDTARQADITVNDLFVSGLLSGLARYHRGHRNPAGHLRFVMPVSTRRPGDPVEANRFVPARVVLPCDLDRAHEYLARVPALLRRWKHSRALAIDEWLTAVLDRLPDPLVVRVFSGILKGVDVIATDIPGPPVDLFLGGAKLEQLFAFAPTAGAAVNASLVTVAGRPHVGLNVDVAAVPDPDVLLGCLEQGFEDVVAAARDASGPNGTGEAP